ncbi:helix-turn-helix domain-containing protein [Clostridium botulinum]|nr:Cro/Cl family transcriptional regulator [Clostridium botulinum]MBY6778081.1 helix-turn-helix domain-containing protein [Clostridium botulinum]NFF25130.1 helix-turn-helix domain-containing protein [Clostridium botulinum]NFI50053.1 helix-turn-helix domain-containing protein [Clostridium botulinum]NFI61443.1 helix-turn-helix domain-containing protein [Clostridium botulinum]
MNDRFKKIRIYFNKTQEEFANSINIKSKAHISALESGKRSITDRIISDVCAEYNINEEWLRNGIEPMFIEPDTFSLDEYVKQKGATDFELEIIKSFFEMDPEIRKAATEQFKASLLSKLANTNELAATKEESFEDYKKKELEAYALELEAESKGEISSASGKRKDA